jgi:hypothetical protein
LTNTAAAAAADVVGGDNRKIHEKMSDFGWIYLKEFLTHTLSLVWHRLRKRSWNFS